jgi:type II secretory pathway pseudopilin PulG
MSGLTRRRGAGLVELIVAMSLSAICAVAATSAMAGAERYMRRARATSDARRMVREAAAVLAFDLRAATGDSLRVRGDTAVDFLGLVGLSVVCVSSGPILVLPPDEAADGLPYSSWRAPPESGDLLAVFDTSGTGVWRATVVESAAERTDGAGCGPSTGLLSGADSAARRPVMRVVLRSSLDSVRALVGAPVRVVRGARYALTRAADASWSLSYRRCLGPTCGVAQPVAGPLAAPSDSGLTFAFIAGSSQVEALLQAPATAPQHSPASIRLRLTLRNREPVTP